MREMVRKELREYGIPAAAALVALCIAWMNLGRVSYVLLEPHAEVSVLVVLGAALAGVALGYAQFAVERARGTFAYLVHRRGGHAELFRAKAVVGIALALCIGMLPPVVFGLAKLAGPYAPLVQTERIVEHALAGLVAIPAWGAGVLVALFSRSVLASLVSGLLATFGITLVSSVSPLPVMRMSALAPLVFLAEVLVAGWLILVFARGVFASVVDRDATLAWKRQFACALLALPLFVQPAWILASGAATTAQHSLFDSYPELVRDADGFRVPEPGSVFDDESVRALLGCEWRVHSPRMDSLAVEVRSTKDASTLYAHTFEPQTGEQRLLGAVARVGGLCTPPSTSVVQLLGLASAFPAGGRYFILARGVVDTTAYHLGHVGLGLVAGLLAWLWVARRGGSMREKLLWGVFCSAFGVFALLFFVLLAPRARGARTNEGLGSASRTPVVPQAAA